MGPVPGFPSTRDRKLSFIRRQEDCLLGRMWINLTVGTADRRGLHGVQHRYVEPAPAALPVVAHPVAAAEPGRAG